MKYIVIETTRGGVVREIPFVFPNTMTHSVVFECLCKSEELPNPRIVSGGEIDVGVFNCSGKSVSLGVESRGEIDAQMIEQHDYFHGIK